MKILAVDDQKDVIRSISAALSSDEVVGAGSAREALVTLAGGGFGLALLDVMLGGEDGLALLETIRARFPELPCVMMSGYASVEKAVRAVKLGAYDFLEKPLALEKLRIAVRNAAERSRLAVLAGRENARYRLIGVSRAMRELEEKIAKAAGSDFPALVCGPSGSGKEHVAHLLHLSGARAAGPVIKLNCAAIPEALFEGELFGHAKGAFTGATGVRRGKIEQAEGGTLFLDEIGELPLAEQAKFLRVLEDRTVTPLGTEKPVKVDFRLVCATNRDLPAEAAQGRFREDLYWRIGVIVLAIPPLAERREDIPLLAEHFLARASVEGGTAAKEFSPEALVRLSALPLTGNVRELRNLAQRLAVFSPGEVITERDVEAATAENPVAEGKSPPASGNDAGIFGTTMPLSEAQDALERRYIETQLVLHGGNVTRTATALGILPQNLTRKMRRLGM
jgi:two-component system nitrogen regulation response regulator NtrX